MTRLGKNLGEARRVLRLWTGATPTKVYEPLEPAPRFDRAFVKAQYAKAKPLAWHDYLEKERCIPREVLLSGRFKGRLRVDERGNVLFPHYDVDELCGFEKRSRTFKGFADMGEKGLWTSNCFPEDKILVIGEGAIDCISYEAMHTGHRYASFAGGMSEKQHELIRLACKEMSPGAGVICITHPDADGKRYAEAIEKIANDIGMWCVIDHPEGVKDWNDALRRSAREVFSFPAAL